MKALRKAIRIMCILLAVSLALTAVFFRDNGVEVLGIKSDETLKAQFADTLHSSAEGEFQKIASSGFTELYFDSKTSDVAVKEITQNKMWYSMPEGADGSVLSMQVIASDGVHYLNSQNNSVAFSNWSYELTKDGVTVNYTLTDSLKTAQKESFKDSDIAFSAKVAFTLKDGGFFVSAELKNLSGNTKCAVKSFCILEKFGAFKNPQKDDFFVVPDGCGALAYPALGDKAADYEYKVYGADPSADSADIHSALMGAFGLKCGKSAYAVIIDNAEENAKIRLHCDKNGYSYINAGFDLSDTKQKGKNLYIGSRGASEKAELCYKFLSADNAAYSEIFSACREQFIRNGTLSSSSIKNSDSLPAYITLTGQYKKNPWTFKVKKYTDFSQGLDIVKRIKAKGIDNINVRYKAALKDGTSSLSSSLGGESKFKELYDYTHSQNISLLLDVNILSYESFFGKTDFSAAKNLQKRPSYIIESFASDGFAENSGKYRFRKVSAVNSYVSELIDKTKDYSVSGWCIGDAGRVLISDYSHSGASRGEVKDALSSQIPALSNSGTVVVDTGNFYMIKNSAAVINIPVSVSYEEGEAYVAVPFVQSVLHGMLVMSGEPINTQSDIKTAALKCIEYGVAPNFSAVYESDGGENSVLFDNAVNDIIKTYNEMSAVLCSLEGQRIAEHEKLGKSLFCTTYDNGVRVYVNYSDDAQTVGGVTVKAQSCVRIG